MSVSDDIKLGIFNDALAALGSGRLASLSEDQEARYVLDDVWRNAVDEALEVGDWNFALRAVQIYPEITISTEFGFGNAFTKPNDFVRLSSMAADEYFRTPLTSDQFSDEGRYWLSDYRVLFVRYVSNGDEYGLDGGRWTRAFRRYLSAAIAMDACERITNSQSKLADAARLKSDALAKAKSVDGMNDGPKILPRGGWVRARFS